MTTEALTEHAIRMSADVLELHGKVDDLLEVQGEHTATLNEHSRKLDEHTQTLDEHTEKLDDHTRRLERVEVRLDDLKQSQEQHFSETKASLLEISSTLGELVARSG